MAKTHLEVIAESLRSLSEARRRIFESHRLSDFYSLPKQPYGSVYVIAQFRDMVICFDPEFDEFSYGRVLGGALCEHYAAWYQTIGEALSMSIEGFDTHVRVRRALDEERPVFVEREFRKKSDGSPVIIKIYKPAPGNEYFEDDPCSVCIMTIEGIDTIGPSCVLGVDTFQAAELCMEHARRLLRPFADDLCFYDGDADFFFKEDYIVPDYFDSEFINHIKSLIADKHRNNRKGRQVEDPRPTAAVIEEILSSNESDRILHLIHSVLVPRGGEEELRCARMLLESDDKARKRLGKYLLDILISG
jgi:hypothetical protein